MFLAKKLLDLSDLWIEKEDIGKAGAIVKELTQLDDVANCLEASASRPVMILKHSTACPISAGAYQEVARFLASPPAGCPEFYLVKVIESRPASNEITARLGVPHKSPQVILVKDSQALWSASHYGINVEALKNAIKPVTG